MPLIASNFASNSLQGTVSVENGFANVNLQVEPFALEGNKTFVIKLRKDSFSGTVLSTSSPITIYDYSTVANVTANVSSIAEGNLVQFTVTTTNVTNYANLFFSVLPRSANITSADFTANTGMVTIVNNTGTFVLQANADLSLIDESGETFAVQMRTNSPTGNIVFSNLSNVTILDVSKSFNILSFVASATTVGEGTPITLTFNATNIPVGTVFYWNTDGNSTVSTFSGGNTGSFVMNSYSNTITLNPTGVTYATTQNFNVKLRAYSNTSSVIATSSNIIVIDSAIAYMNATGGNASITSNGYKIHTYNTSGTFNVTSLGLTGNIEYLVVAGGGSGAAAGGGGGGGGILYGISTLTQTANNVITVGGGGTGGGTGSNAGNDGSPSNIIFSSTVTPSTIQAIGGGGGGSVGTSSPSPANTEKNGRPGGSGGGAGGNFYGGVGGTGTPGQGNSGGNATPGPKSNRIGGSNGIGGGGGGAAGSADGILAGDGGAGGLYTITGSNVFFAGGGGGADAFSPLNIGGTGGAGGGGNGATYTGTNAQSGVINSGGGGGSDWSGGPIGSGGAGVVIIRYPFVASPNVTSVTTTSNVFGFGANILFTVNTTDANLVTLYYTTEGNVISSDFINGNTGSFVANANGGIVNLQSNSSATPLKQFRLQIRQDSTTGYLYTTTSGNVIIYPAADYYVTASGGVQSNVGGYRIHTFTTSANLIVTAAGLPNSVEVLLVAGGGGGGAYPPGSSSGSGGGGGGGVVWRANATLAVQTYPIVVGGGGNGGLNTPGGSGTNSTGFSVIATGGGYGGSSTAYPVPQQTGGSGGSGGGGGQSGTGGSSTQSTYAGWFSYGGRGNAGGNPNQPSYGGAGGGAGGPGGGSQNVANGGNQDAGAGAAFSTSGSPVTYAAGGTWNFVGPPTSVSPGTGNGGVGSKGDSIPAGYGTAGAPGVVIIRYPI